MEDDAQISLWIQQIKQGDSTATQRLWERYHHRLVGLAREEVLKSRLIDLFPVSARAGVHRALEDALQHNRATVLRCAIHSGAGADVDVELSVSPILKDMGVDGAFVLATQLSPNLTQIA